MLFVYLEMFEKSEFSPFNIATRKTEIVIPCFLYI